MALDVFGITPVTAEEIAEGEAREVKVLDLHFKQAVQKVSLDNRWSFLNDIIAVGEESSQQGTGGTWQHVSLSLGKDEGPKAGYAHSFKLPDGIMRIAFVESENLKTRRVGNVLLSDCAEPIVYAHITANVVPENTAIPDTFWTLVAYQLAFLSAPALSNSDQKVIQMVASTYNDLLSSALYSDLSEQNSYMEES
jgi:hypothetical protein